MKKAKEKAKKINRRGSSRQSSQQQQQASSSNEAPKLPPLPRFPQLPPASLLRNFTDRENENIENLYKGVAVRKQVTVNNVAPNITHTRIKPPPEGIPSVGGKPGEIMQNMIVGDTYDRLRVKQGAGNGGVKVAPPPRFNQGRRTDSVSTLANDLTSNTAVINGGFYDPYLEMSSGGYPVGKTKDREANEEENIEKSFVPISEPYRDDYRALKVGDEVGIHSGPILEPSNDNFKDERFQYENSKKYSDPGFLTHASQKNPRAAISIFPPKEEMPGDVIMHTLTTGNAPRGKNLITGANYEPHGATMEEWKNITTIGSDINNSSTREEKKGKGKEKDKKYDLKKGKIRPDTLNLDGGGSVYMGITRGNGQTDKIACQRAYPPEISNIIFAGGGQENEGKEISIKKTEKNESKSCNLM